MNGLGVLILLSYKIMPFTELLLITTLTKPYAFNNANSTNLQTNADDRVHPVFVKDIRNKKSENTSTHRMDHTIIGAIVIGSIFLFITISITITVIIFCLKKNTVFVFQKSEQEDINDCTYDDCTDTLSCHSYLHYLDRRGTTLRARQITNRDNPYTSSVNEYLEKCPLELFYPLHYDKPCPSHYTQVNRPTQQKFQPCLSHVIRQPSIWTKPNEGPPNRPLFRTDLVVPTYSINVRNFVVTLDLTANCRVVTMKESKRTSSYDNLEDSQTVLTPLGKSQTYTDMNPLELDNNPPLGGSQLLFATKLTKSVSDHESMDLNI